MTITGDVCPDRPTTLCRVSPSSGIVAGIGRANFDALNGM